MDKVVCVFCGKPAYVGSYCSGCWRAERKQSNAKQEPAKGVTAMPAPERPGPGQPPSATMAGRDASGNEASSPPPATKHPKPGGSRGFKPLLRVARNHPWLVPVGLIVIAPKVWAWLVSEWSGTAAASPAVPTGGYEPVPMVARYVTAIAVTIVSAGVGYLLLRLAPTPIPLPQLPPFPVRTKEQHQQRAQYDNRKAIETLPFLVGPLIGGSICVLSHTMFLSFAGWTWGPLVGFIVLGLAAALIGASLGDAAQQAASERSSSIVGSTGVGTEQAVQQDAVAWSRKVQRGSQALKRWGHRKTLYGVAALWWVSRFFSNAIKAAQHGNRRAMGQIESYEDSWFTGGLIGRAQDTARLASDRADRVLQLIGYWNTICDLLALAATAWAMFYLWHDCRVRDHESGTRGAFGRELLGMAGVNLAIWLLLLWLWPF